MKSAALYGRIERIWSLNADDYEYNFVIPANTSATMYLSAKSEKDIRIQKRRLSRNSGVSYLGVKDGKFGFELQPASYQIQVKKYPTL
ncbi:alpha-L-rhamnosidase C-terminal domain-containing protein [Desertivirga brevis]|uniref:alpha-L-rhamnosidase C-terminal domain-containing protein n=1 Tax=Desertivirga brevis TaxID=2810310 RepID=UPI001A95E27E